MPPELSSFISSQIKFRSSVQIPPLGTIFIEMKCRRIRDERIKGMVVLSIIYYTDYPSVTYSFEISRISQRVQLE